MEAKLVILGTDTPSTSSTMIPYTYTAKRYTYSYMIDPKRIMDRLTEEQTCKTVYGYVCAYECGKSRHMLGSRFMTETDR